MVKRSYVREIAIVALLSAASTAGRLALAAMPGVQPTTVIVIITTMSLGLKQGIFVVIISTLLSNVYLGHGPWTLFQILAWTVVAVISHFYGRSQFRENLFISSLFAGLTGIIYGMVVSIYGLQFHSNIIAYYLMGLPHDISHAIGNFVIYLVLGGRLHQLLNEFAQKYFCRN
ncbi:MAG: ECF transporter S component [Firmicutes bacterium]|nr:ECF transporter S component [Bacillota bacterium]